MADNLIRTCIWHEQAEPDNPFATRAAYCRGYDVFGSMLGNARWVEMLWLLFRDELPPPAELDMLEALAVALANPGPRDASVHAAMCGGVGGSTAAASLIAALSVGAGRNGGAREVYDAVIAWRDCGTDLSLWQAFVGREPEDEVDIWPGREHPPGFDPHGVSTTTCVRQLLDALVNIGATERLVWLGENYPELERTAKLPLGLSGVVAAAFADLGFSPEQTEMLCLMLRLPGAAAHALEQTGYGYRQFPFYPVELEDDPAGKEAT